jgi:uncharacterized delta-60 repeat protein
MAKLLLGISGRVELGETLSLVAYNTTTGTASTSGFTLQWQSFSAGSWSNVGSANSVSYSIPTGTSTVGRLVRVVATPVSAGDEASQSLATAAVVQDKSNARAPTLADVATVSTIAEGATPTLIDSSVTFNDQDNANYGGGSLLVLNSNAAAAGGDGRDVLSVRHQGTGSGQIGYNSATGDVTYQSVVIGRADATSNGNGEDLLVTFNANATKVAVDRLIENLQWTNTDDSPAPGRLLTIRVTDATAGTVQSVVTAKVTPVADAPVFAGAASLLVDENQFQAGTIAATDPDREAGTPQGIAYSLVGGAGSTDNAAFAIDAASGALRFLSAPDFEAAHAPSYAVRVRASDSNGGVSERAITVQVGNVNEAPVAQPLSGAALENGPAISIAAAFADPDAGDTHTIALDTAQTLGTVSRTGNNFSYAAGSAFDALAQGQTATDTFSYTVTDAGGLASTRTATVTVTGVNDAASIAGNASAAVQEDVNVVAGKLRATGVLTITDPDTGESRFQPVQGGIAPVFDLAATGEWLFEIDNADPIVQALGAGQTRTETLVAHSADGSASRTISVTITGSNDAPVITGGTTTGLVVEAGVLANGEVAPGTPLATGALSVTDADAGDTFAWSASGQGAYGAFAIDAQTGNWTYSLDNALAEPMAQGQTATETFTATVTDGHGASATRQVTIEVRGGNDAPELLSADTQGSVTESSPNGQLYLDAREGGATGFAVDANGRMLLVGPGDYNLGEQLRRLNADGSRDTSFGDDGFVSLHANVTFSQVAVDSQGRYVVGGRFESPSSGGDFAVSRYLADGSLDTAFGTNGLVTLAFTSDEDTLAQIHALPDGKLLVSGNIRLTTQTDADFGIARLNADGSLDTSFGTGGRLQIPEVDVFQGYRELTVDAEGRLLVWGRGYNYEEETPAGYLLEMVRYLPDGQVDTTFANGGLLEFSLGGWYANGPVAVDVDPLGGFVLGWNAYESANGHHVNLSRFGASGNLDTDFGADGTAVTTLQTRYSSGFSLAVDSQGRPVVVPDSSSTTWGASDFLVARFNSDGSPDASFGDNGRVTTDLGSDEQPFTVHIADNDAILAVGNIPGMYGGSVAMVRYNANGGPDTSFGGLPDDSARGYANARDPEGMPLTWSGDALGEYGVFDVDPWGGWLYTVDNARPATQALAEGQTATESFMVMAMDPMGAVVTHPVVVTITGTYDAPPFG